MPWGRGSAAAVAPKLLTCCQMGSSKPSCTGTGCSMGSQARGSSWGLSSSPPKLTLLRDLLELSFLLAALSRGKPSPQSPGLLSETQFPKLRSWGLVRRNLSRAGAEGGSRPHIPRAGLVTSAESPSPCPAACAPPAPSHGAGVVPWPRPPPGSELPSSPLVFRSRFFAASAGH